METIATTEQHRALLHDCWEIADALPTSGVLNRAGNPYRATRFERRLRELEADPVGLQRYISGMARRTSEGLDPLVRYDRLDLSVEVLILDESKPYASLFSVEDRAAAREKLEGQERRVADFAREYELEQDEADRALIATMNTRRKTQGRPPLDSDQEASVLENRRRNRV